MHPNYELFSRKKLSSYFKNDVKQWTCNKYPCRFYKVFLPNLGIIWHIDPILVLLMICIVILFNERIQDLSDREIHVQWQKQKHFNGMWDPLVLNRRYLKITNIYAPIYYYYCYYYYYYYYYFIYSFFILSFFNYLFFYL